MILVLTVLSPPTAVGRLLFVTLLLLWLESREQVILAPCRVIELLGLMPGRIVPLVLLESLHGVLVVGRVLQPRPVVLPVEQGVVPWLG